MNIVLWIIAGLLAAVFAFAGLTKVVQSKEAVLASGQGGVADFPAGAVKLIGALEALAAVGLILPPLLDITPVLVPLAAIGVALMMAGAAVVHARRKENSAIGVNLVLLLLAAVVAWGRVGPYAF